MLDDEPCVLDALKIIMQFVFNDAKILTCTGSEEALQELAQEAPIFSLQTGRTRHFRVKHCYGFWQRKKSRIRFS